MQRLGFSFYGITVRLESVNAAVIDDLRRDFAFFHAASASDEAAPALLTIVIDARPPAYDGLPQMRARYTTPRNVCYYHAGTKYVDYGGQALVKYEKQRGVCLVQCAEYPLLHQICYMLVLSLVGERLDDRGVHRVHALGLATQGGAALILLDAGGGKTNLALGILAQENGVRLISEDSPLIDRSGRVLPFPIRIGVRPPDLPAAFPPRYLRHFPRDEGGDKILIDTEAFGSRIACDPSQPDLVLLGTRTLGTRPRIQPAPRLKAFAGFLKNCVVGMGLYQGLEYLFAKGLAEAAGRIPCAFSRTAGSLKVLRRSEVFEFFLGTDRGENVKVLSDFLDRRKRRGRA